MPDLPPATPQLPDAKAPLNNQKFQEAFATLDSKIAKIVVFHELDTSVFEDLQKELLDMIALVVIDAHERNYFGGIGSPECNDRLRTLCIRQDTLTALLDAIQEAKLNGLNLEED